MDKEILVLLKELSEKIPHERFGQLLFNYTPIGTRVGQGAVHDPFHYPDEEFIRYLKYHLENIDRTGI